MNQLFAVSNPFATRFVRPGALEFRFAALSDSIGKDGIGDGPCETAAACSHTDLELGETRLEEVVDELHQHRVGLLVGHHGSGKSTLVHALTPRLNSRFGVVRHVQFCHERQQHLAARMRVRYRMIQQLRSQIKNLPRGGLLTLDGAEQLARFEFRLLCRKIRRRGVALLATCHTPISNVHILHRTVVTPQLVSDLTEELIANASGTVRDRVRQWLSDRPIATEANVRDLFFDLYDVAHEARPLPQSKAANTSRSKLA
ncbi:MAG: hypothetical protein P8L85_10775 [Rubripirellula sp.]|nr:hypothetical protein [Rubripirellula sp.]